jgi:hypothetical protein
MSMKASKVLRCDFVVTGQVFGVRVFGVLVQIRKPDQKGRIAAQDMNVLVAGIVHPKFQPTIVAGVDVETRYVNQSQ